MGVNCRLQMESDVIGSRGGERGSKPLGLDGHEMHVELSPS